jgi:hypothetical protein
VQSDFLKIKKTKTAKTDKYPKIINATTIKKPEMDPYVY